MIGILKTLMVVVNLNITWFVKKNIAACLAGFLFGSQDIARKTRMNLKETTTMLRVFFPSFLYRICFIFVLALLLNFFDVGSSTWPVCFFLLYFLTSFFSIKFITYQKKKIKETTTTTTTSRIFSRVSNMQAFLYTNENETTVK